MTKHSTAQHSTTTHLKTQILEASLAHVVFDGWSDTVLRAACQDCGISQDLAKSLFPRGAIDLAVAFHKQGDAEMLRRLHVEPPAANSRFRDRIALALRYRLEAISPHKDVVHRSMALFALPQNSPEGMRLLWETADQIWTALGDKSDDYNWYTKRATLSAVYGATVLYWLGDDSDQHQATWAFLDRRIENVMQIETVKARLRSNPFTARLLKGPEQLLSHLRPPNREDTRDLPGILREPETPHG